MTKSFDIKIQFLHTNDHDLKLIYGDYKLIIMTNFDMRQNNFTDDFNYEYLKKFIDFHSRPGIIPV